MLIDFDQLFLKYHIQPSGVLHVGANYGQEAETYRSHRIPYVIWVEALPEAYRNLVRHVSLYGKNNWCINACVSNVDDKEIVFNIASNQGQSSSMLEFGTHALEHPSVTFIGQVKLKTKRLDTILIGARFNGDWFLNMDLQGAELLALEGLGERLHDFKWVYIEVNEKELYKGCPLVQDISAYLRKFGFIMREKKMTNHGWGDALYIK